MNNEIDFYVYGIPQPGGSKKAFFNRKTGRAIVVEDAKRNKDWRAAVAMAAGEVAATRTGLLDCPLRVRFDFYFPRPKGHFGSGKKAGQIKASAPAFPAVRPDCTKILRSTEDAIKGILWRDDCLIVTQAATKRYVENGGSAGCRIRITEEKA